MSAAGAALPLAAASPRVRLAARTALALCALLFSLPFLLSVVLHAGFLDLANEPLAYRYFYSERIFGGETIVVGVGYLISLLHHTIYAFLGVFLPPSLATLPSRLDLFALITNGVLSGVVCVLMLVAARSKRLTLGDGALLILVTLIPIYGTRGVGYDYALMVDYNFLNIILCVATLLVFQLLWRRQSPAPAGMVFLAGAFVGLAVANKITMLVVAGVLLVPAVVHESVGLREFSRRATLALVGMIASFVAVHVASYLGNLKALARATTIWWKFVSQPGGEPEFWKTLFRQFIESYDFGDVIAYSLVVLAVTLLGLALQRQFTRRTTMLVAFCLCAYAACAFFVVKRPAQSTLFESTIFVFTLTGVLLCVNQQSRAVGILIVASFVGWLGFCAVKFPYTWAYERIAESRERSEIKWEAFKLARQLGGARKMEVVIPDNSFHHEGVFEMLLKAASDFPTWHITKGRDTVLRRYAPGMSFRHNYGGKSPNAPYSPGEAIVWFDRVNSPPLTLQYSVLGTAVARAGVVERTWSMPIKEGGGNLTMHLALLPGARVGGRR